MRKELTYEYSMFPPAEKAFNCLRNRLELEVREEDMSGTLRAMSKDRSFLAQLMTQPKQRGGLKVVVTIRATDETQMSAVIACFGEPHRERKIEPSASMFAEAVLETQLGENIDLFISKICRKLEIDREKFVTYRAMILSTSKLHGTSVSVQKAAEKLQQM